MKDKADLTTGKISRSIFTMAVPTVAASFLHTGYNLIDNLFASTIGDIEVGAVTFIMPISFTILSLAQGLSIAGVSLISQSKGAGDDQKVNHFAVHILLLGLILALAIGIGGYIYGDLMLSGLGLTGELLESARDYIGFIFLATPFMFFTVIYGGIRNSEGRARRSLAAQAIALMLNVFFNYLFISHFSMGIRGLALATLCARGIAALYGALDLLMAKHGLRLNPGGCRLSWSTVRFILRLGIPAAFARMSQSVGILVLNVLIVRMFGDIVLAAFGIGSRINSLFFMPSTGFGMALSAIVGQNIGAGKTDRAKKAVRLTLAYSMVFSILGSVALYSISPWLASVFSDTPEVIHHANNYMRIVAISVIPWGIFQAMTGVFQGAGFTRSAMLISLIRLWILRLPMLLMMHRFTGMQEYSIWYSMLISNIITAVASIILYYVVPWTRGLGKLRINGTPETAEKRTEKK